MSPKPVVKAYVKLSPTSGSVVEMEPMVVPMAEFSATVALLRAKSVGLSLTGLIVMFSVSVSVKAPPEPVFPSSDVTT